MLTTILTLLLVDVFDTAGTLVAVAERSGIVRPDGSLPRLRARAPRRFLGHRVGCAPWHLVHHQLYRERGGGCRRGADGAHSHYHRPALPGLPLPRATGPERAPLCHGRGASFVACLMARGLADLPWDDLTEAAPAVVTALSMPLFFPWPTASALALSSMPW